MGERREHPDYDKLARALLEHAAIQARDAIERDVPEPPALEADDQPEAQS